MLVFGRNGRQECRGRKQGQAHQIKCAGVYCRHHGPDQRADAKVLLKLMQSAAGDKPKMWGPSNIGFGSYHYRYDSGREGDMPVIAFSPRKAATVLYNMTGFKGSEALLAKLGRHTAGKGCLYIKKLTDVDQKVLAALAVKSVAAMRARHSS